jgi:hypothetical protein
MPTHPYSIPIVVELGDFGNLGGLGGTHLPCTVLPSL